MVAMLPPIPFVFPTIFISVVLHLLVVLLPMVLILVMQVVAQLLLLGSLLVQVHLRVVSLFIIVMEMVLHPFCLHFQLLINTVLPGNTMFVFLLKHEYLIAVQGYLIPVVSPDVSLLMYQL